MNAEILKNVRPLLLEGSMLYASTGYSIFQIDLETGFKEDVVKVPAPLVEHLISKSTMATRILRRGIHGFFLPTTLGYTVLTKGKVTQFDFKAQRVKNTFTGFQGSRPLRWAYNAHFSACFGEYFGNPQREEVKIFGTKNGEEWEVLWTFPKRTIRHVHGIFWDPYRNGFWVTTGDDDHESTIWFTDDNFGTLTSVLSGSQMTRAVDIIPTKDGLIIPTDTPREENWIQFFDMDKLTKNAPIIGSAFHAKSTQGLYLVSTVTEPSKVNHAGGVGLYISLNGTTWKQIEFLQKDIFPLSTQKYTRYSELELVTDCGKSEYVVGYGRALRKYDNCALVWKKNDLKSMLSDTLY